MAFVTSRDGTRIGYDLRGTGPLLITVAGATQYRAVDSEGTPKLADGLADRFSVVIFDRRGRGESGDTAPYAVAREIEDIEALIDAHGGRAFLFGMSSGAVLALEAAAALGNKITGLVLYEPPIDPAKGSADYQSDHAEMARLAARGEAGAMMSSFLGGVMPPDALAGFQQSPAWPAFEAVGLTLEHDYRVMADARSGDAPPDRWTSVTAPVLVLDGDASFPFMKAGADWVAAGVPGAQRVTLEGQSHQFDPDVVAAQIRRFI